MQMQQSLLILRAHLLEHRTPHHTHHIQVGLAVVVKMQFGGLGFGYMFVGMLHEVVRLPACVKVPAYVLSTRQHTDTATLLACGLLTLTGKQNCW